MQISRIQDRIQEMRINNAQANLEINSNQKSNNHRLSTSCPSLNESSDPLTILETTNDNTSTDNSNHRGSNNADRNLNLNQRQRRAQDQMLNNTKRKTRPQQGTYTQCENFVNFLSSFFADSMKSTHNVFTSALISRKFVKKFVKSTVLFY